MTLLTALSGHNGVVVFISVQIQPLCFSVDFNASDTNGLN